MVVTRGCGKGDGELVFNEHRVSVWEDEVLEMMVMMVVQQCKWI